ncbi:hypothetical protein BO71DRAFT_60716 [Aspergillus ellipticus CBS 707.79]|uniref:Uncharacterized protein n=1 Tax=Aspergillus ellipticus CBS 707.79 TaxID=1448320 RepID=A0A319DIL9_9EURO|nr:hypothetical protein BO71DRAFT_60716 [Aspergillus ellipticus CBS 707.79]
MHSLRNSKSAVHGVFTSELRLTKEGRLSTEKCLQIRIAVLQSWKDLSRYCLTPVPLRNTWVLMERQYRRQLRLAPHQSESVYSHVYWHEPWMSSPHIPSSAGATVRLRRAKATNNALRRYPCARELFDYQATLLPCQQYLMADKTTPPRSSVSSPLTPPPTNEKATSNIRSILSESQSHYRGPRPTPWLVYSLRREKYEDVLQSLRSNPNLNSQTTIMTRATRSWQSGCLHPSIK